MLFSVVVVNWNSQADLRECLESLRHQLHSELEVIVVDNGSTDGSPDMVEAEFAEVKLQRESENLGFAEACNRGIDASRGEWVAMLNNDAVAEPEWALELVKVAKSSAPECGMLQSLLLYRTRPDVINSTGIVLRRSGEGSDRFEGKPREMGRIQEEIFCPTAGAAAYRRSMLDAIRIRGGYFDRTHFMYSEDMDLGWRARLAGYSSFYVPSSIAFHRWHGSTERHGRSWLSEISNRNRVRTLIKNGSIGLLLKTLPTSLEALYNVIRHGGVRGLAGLVRAVQESLETRKEVNQLARRPRRDVESEWIRERNE